MRSSRAATRTVPLLALAGLLVLTGCGSGGDDVAAPASPSGSQSATAGSGLPSDGSATTGPSGSGLPSESPSARRGSPPVPKSPPALPPEAQGGLLTLVRSGGLGGATTLLVVRLDGTVLVKGGTGAPRTTMSPARLGEVRALATSPALASEARQASASGPLRQPRCSDAFQYDLTAGDLRMTAVACGPISSYPTFRRLLQLLGPLLG